MRSELAAVGRLLERVAAGVGERLFLRYHPIPGGPVNWRVLCRLIRVVAATMVEMAPIPISAGLLLDARYRLDDRVAEGGMGEVWRATDLALDRLVAVKLLRAGYSEREDDLARFRAEARHGGSLSHPGIAQVYDYHDADPPYPPFLVMELVDGPSLSRLLDEGPLDPARTMDLIAQAARALQAAHVAGVVHRDIKPGNLLISQGEHVKITDFGIAHAAGSASLTRPGALIGTPAYLAPERAVGAPARPSADLYALGIVAFQCLTGELPFTGEPLAIALAHQERPLPPLPLSVPAEVAALVADLTAKDPQARPGSAAEVAERAEYLRTVPPATAPTATAPLQMGKRERYLVRHPARPAVAAAAVAVIAAAGWGITAMHGPAPAHSQSTPPTASPQSGSRASHPASRDVPGGGASVAAGTTGARARDAGSKASRKSPASSATSSGTLTPTGTPIPSGTPAPSGTPTPTSTGTPTPSGTPTPAGTPTPTGTPTPVGTPTPADV